MDLFQHCVRPVFSSNCLTVLEVYVITCFKAQCNSNFFNMDSKFIKFVNLKNKEKEEERRKFIVGKKIPVTDRYQNVLSVGRYLLQIGVKIYCR